ncbi:unnamed protein product [Cercospora beticola]|nr:unnamed protein product [Cercospora beticola]
MSTTTHPDVSATEGTFLTSDNVSLYTRTWSSTTTPLKARLIFLHGFSDHCNFYGDFFPSLALQGIKVYAYDQRGWGRNVASSPSERGNTGNTDRILSDLESFIQHVLSVTSESDIPLFLMGHSMGGGEVLYYASSRGPGWGAPETKARIRGYLCEAPIIALHPAAKPWRVTQVVGKLVSKVLPRQQIVQKLDASKLCRDPEVCKEWVADELNHDTGTLECLANLLERARLMEEAKEVVLKDGQGEGGKTRLWIGFGTGDEVLSFEACEKWFKGLKDVEDKELRVYEGWYHKLHAEPGEDKKTYAKDVSQWILERSGPVETLGVKARL